MRQQTAFPNTVSVTLMATSLAIAAFESFVLRDCDMKLGCSGGVLFLAFLALFAAIVSYAAAALAQRMLLPGAGATTTALLLAGATTGVALALALPTAFSWSRYVGLLGLSIAWFVVTAVLALVLLAAARHSAPKT